MAKKQNKEPFSYSKYSVSILYKKECLAVYKPIPEKLLEVLINYVHGAININFDTLKEIVVDIEGNDFDLWKIKHNLQAKFPNNSENLSKVISVIDKCYYDILLSKVKDEIANNDNPQKLDWYFAKADHNGLSLNNLINDTKCYIENNDKFSPEKMKNYGNRLDGHLELIKIEFNNNGQSDQVTAVEDYRNDIVGDIIFHINVGC